MSKIKTGKFLNCEVCNKSIYTIKSRVPRFRFCSYECRDKSLKGKRISPKTEFKKGEHLGKNHPNYKGGSISKNGYKMIHCNGKQVYEHRLVMEKYLGRKLLKSENIHHINHIKTDNSINNLQIISNISHLKLHYPKGSYFGIHKSFT